MNTLVRGGGWHAVVPCSMCLCFFFFNDTATTEIYTLSLHDALPIWTWSRSCLRYWAEQGGARLWIDRKSTRLNSSHLVISYAVFCLKKKSLKIYTGIARDTLSYAKRHQRSGHRP